MFHTAAYTVTVGQTADTAMTGLVDAVLTRSVTSSNYILQMAMNLFAAAAFSANINRCKLVSPTLRQINTPYVRPIMASARPTSNGKVMWLGDQPYALPAFEELGPLFTSDIGAGNETGWLLLWLGDVVQPIPAGNVINCRFTATITAGVGVWTIGGITLEQALPPGLYAIVGSECWGTTQICHRWQIPNQLYRPGMMSHQAQGDIQDDRLITRRLGVMGQFYNTAPPQLEILCTAADTTQNGILQVVKIG